VLPASIRYENTWYREGMIIFSESEESP